jgi:ribosomal subunit interface protein
MIKSIHSTDFEVTEALHSHINGHLAKIQHQHDKITRVDVFLKKDKFKFVAEFKVSVPNTEDVVVSCSSEDMYHSITDATNKVLIKLKKLKEKQKGKLHQKIALAE